MRVVDVTSFFSASCGGIKTYYQAKARLLPALGVDCHFIVPGATAGEEAFEQAVLHRLPGPFMPGNRHYRLFRRLRDVTALCARLAPDVVEIGSHYLLPGALERMAWPAGRRAPRLIGFFHSDIARTLVAPVLGGLPGPLARPLMAGVWRWVRRQHARYQATLVASHATLGELRARGIPRVRWVGMGVDTEVFCPPATTKADRPPTVVYAGRLSWDKSLGLLLAAWPEIQAATGARLRLLGDGPQLPRLRRFAAERPEVQVDGHVSDRAALAAALGAAAVVVTPGARETFSLGTAEALACGTPVVAPSSGGAGELVAASGAGLAFRPDDPQALAGAVIELLGRPAAARAQLGARGRAHVLSEHTWTRVMRRIHEVYQEAGEGGRRPDAEVAA